MPQRRAAILTLGCKLNLADSEEIARGLRDAGFEVVDHVCEADAYVVNTCAVTHVADAKSRKLVRSVRRLSPTARVAVTGCYPRAAAPAELDALGADLVTNTRDEGKAALVSFLAGACQPAAPVDVAPPGLFTARAFIKAQEGCNDVCAFCIVPRTRGRESSRPVAEVVAAWTRRSRRRPRGGHHGHAAGCLGEGPGPAPPPAAPGLGPPRTHRGGAHPLQLAAAPGHFAGAAGPLAGPPADAALPPRAAIGQRCHPGSDAPPLHRPRVCAGRPGHPRGRPRRRHHNGCDRRVPGRNGR